jgi:hypothetical protein
VKIKRLDNFELEFPEILKQDPNYRDKHEVPLKVQVAGGRAHTPYGVLTLAQVREALDVLDRLETVMSVEDEEGTLDL